MQIKNLVGALHAEAVKDIFIGWLVGQNGNSGWANMEIQKSLRREMRAEQSAFSIQASIWNLRHISRKEVANCQ
jgi:hypothetical protein